MTHCPRALAAVLSALVLLTGGCADNRDRPAPGSRTGSPTASESTAPAGPVAWVDRLPVGDPPKIGYVVGHTFVGADGATVRLRLGGRGVTSITRLGDGLLVTDDRSFEGTTGIARLTADGIIDPSLTRPGHQPGYGTVASRPVLSADGSTVHWLTFTPPESGVSDPTMVHAGDVATGAITSVEIDVSPTFLTSLLGVVGDDVVFRPGWVGHGKTYVRDGASAPRRVPALDGASTINPRARLVSAFLGRRGAVGAVLDYDSRRVLWRERALTPYSFSPSGRRLLARTHDGFVVLEARTGDPQGRLGATTALQGWALASGVWEDDHHLLVGVVRGGRAAIVRCDVRTGRWEVAVDWSHLEGTHQVTFETHA